MKTVKRQDNDIVIQMPRTYHRQLARLAIREGVTLEEYCLAAIAEYIGAERAAEELEGRIVNMLRPVRKRKRAK